MDSSNDKHINDLFEIAINKLSCINYLNLCIKNETKNSLAKNNKVIEEHAKHGRAKQLNSSSNFLIYSPYSNELEYYGRQILTLEDKHKIIKNNFHKRRLWLIVDMHEILKEYVESICKILNISKEKNRLLLQTLKDKFSNIREIENNNRHPIGLIVYIVQKLRHCIVHKQGVIKDKSKFINTILKNTGNKNNDGYRSQIEKFITESGEIITGKNLFIYSGAYQDYFNDEFFYSICQEIIIINTEILRK
jgi:hypothetical protein